uniref:Putative secreted protein n=1 Tax=Anopheles triannulatus TaxID=58253 RepID=A0A2M4B3P5_9DIPT
MVNWIAMFLLPASMSFHHSRCLGCQQEISVEIRTMMVSRKSNLLPSETNSQKSGIFGFGCVHGDSLVIVYPRTVKKHKIWIPINKLSQVSLT